MKNIVANPISMPCTTACSLSVASRWALAGLGLAVVILGLLVIA